MPSTNPKFAFDRIGPLVEVRQVTVEAKLHRTAGPFLDANVHQESGWTIEIGYLVCTSDCKVEISQTVDGDPVFSGRVVYAAVYQIIKGKKPTEASLRKFMEQEVIATLEPYVRESFQSLTLKSGLPPFILPHNGSLRDVNVATAKSHPTPSRSSSQTKKLAATGARPQARKTPRKSTASGRSLKS